MFSNLNDGIKIIKESKSNYALEIFGLICLSLLSVIFLICCSQVFFKDVVFLNGIDISKICAVAIGTSVSIPLAIILLVNIIVPQKLTFNSNGISKLTLGVKSFMAWSDILEVHFEEYSQGPSGEGKQKLVVVGKKSSMNIMPVFEISQKNLSEYIMQQVKHQKSKL